MPNHIKTGLIVFISLILAFAIATPIFLLVKEVSTDHQEITQVVTFLNTQLAASQPAASTK